MTMNNNKIARRSDSGAAKTPDDEWSLMNAALSKVGMATLPERRETPLPVRRKGRLIVALDLTGSREPTLKHARIATAAMFDAIKTLGSIEVQLVYFRGVKECRASKWHSNPAVVSDAMRKLSCEVGTTQIERVLRLALAEKDKVSGLVFVGDHCEDNFDELINLAKQCGKKSMPLFVFHECADDNGASLNAKPVFKAMAEASGGVYVEFKPDSGAVLREVLASVAAFSTAGSEGLKQVEAARTPEARQLQTRLMLGPGKEK